MTAARYHSLLRETAGKKLGAAPPASEDQDAATPPPSLSDR